MQAAIQDAADILKDDGWTVCVLAETAHGDPTSPVDPMATRRCLLGALQYAFHLHEMVSTDGGYILDPTFEDVLKRLAPIAGVEDDGVHMFDLWDDLAGWNNDQDSAEPVIAALEVLAESWED